jgi:hypothetical protein
MIIVMSAKYYRKDKHIPIYIDDKKKEVYFSFYKYYNRNTVHVSNYFSYTDYRRLNVNKEQSSLIKEKNIKKIITFNEFSKLYKKYLNTKLKKISKNIEGLQLI